MQTRLSGMYLYGQLTACEHANVVGNYHRNIFKFQTFNAITRYESVTVTRFCLK